MFGRFAGLFAEKLCFSDDLTKTFAAMPPVPKVFQISRDTPDANTRALALLRIAVGLLFLIFAQYKILGTEFTLGGGILRKAAIVILRFLVIEWR
ncbi:MAG TPA: hypothetical protein VGJ02_09065 [Pyrinomonadaceae bacterium]|jgi:hypothetical protein